MRDAALDEKRRLCSRGRSNQRSKFLGGAHRWIAFELGQDRRKVT
jgi:hypothetical protein